MKKPEFEQYITEDNPEYISEMEEIKEKKKPKAYGERELENYRELQAMLAQGETHRWGKLIDEEIENVFMITRRYAGRDLDDPYHQKRYVSFFNQALQDEQIGPQLAHFITTDGKLDIRNAKNFLNDYKYNNDIWAKVLERHIAEFKIRAETILAKAELARNGFLEAARKEIKNGQLPITEELLERRVKETAIYVTDQMVDSRAGTYKNHVITLVDTADESDIEHAVYHELSHACSGRITAKSKIGDMYLIENVRIGLSTMQRGTDTSPYQRKMDWLNEALTERMALRLLGKPNDNRARVYERAALNTLFQRGLSEEMAYDAYFENYDPKRQKGLPAWKKLMEAIRSNESLHKHFLWLDKTMPKMVS